MSLLVDLFGYLSIVLHGLTIVAQSMALGGVLFLVLLARPFEHELGAGPRIVARIRTLTFWSAGGDGAGRGAGQRTSGRGADVDGRPFVPRRDAGHFRRRRPGEDRLRGADRRGDRARHVAGAEPGAFGAGRDRAGGGHRHHACGRQAGELTLLLSVEWLHQLGAAIWIGGIPSFLIALAEVHDGAGWRRIGARFSRLSMLGVGCILASGITMFIAYIGSLPAFYGTAYGVMVGAKIGLFLGLLALGAGNFLVTERLRRDPNASVVRMKRFAEVEIGLGFSIFFAAASLTSVPPAVDLTQDRVTWHEIIERKRTGLAAPELSGPRRAGDPGAAGQDRRPGGAAASRRVAGIRARRRHAAAAQRRRHRLVGIQPPLGPACS